MCSSEISYADYFDNWDGVQDAGALDKEELIDGFAQAGIKVSQCHVKVLPKASNKDRGGKIDKEKEKWIEVAPTSLPYSFGDLKLRAIPEMLSAPPPTTPYSPSQQTQSACLQILIPAL